ncbi:hypothetical protein C1645_827890 [Glomus cerebriforme]|uniref:Uncharacterized protein n=1 Tax=Glomus cerebriforme TaxID=658196 RepID=A0A397SNU6_9GLOM|nr:hypothetical protein C1645_827890 [Glomus cerebriforme]
MSDTDSTITHSSFSAASTNKRKKCRYNLEGASASALFADNTDNTDHDRSARSNRSHTSYFFHKDSSDNQIAFSQRLHEAQLEMNGSDLKVQSDISISPLDILSDTKTPFLMSKNDHLLNKEGERLDRMCLTHKEKMIFVPKTSENETVDSYLDLIYGPLIPKSADEEEIIEDDLSSISDDDDYPSAGN